MLEKKERISQILNALNKNIHEREDIFSVSLLSALADQNIFLYGPPGTAKSLISRRLSKVFKSENYFEYLMQKFSTPDEVFGPVSIKELKNDNYERKTEGYLANAQFAFLDEIWKSSPAILNTLLTVINEKIFRNGNELKKVPLQVLISASNETPPKGQGLEALYDRFLTRLYVPPLEDRNNFETLMQNGGSTYSVNLDEKLLIDNEEWEKWKSEFKEVKISTETFNIINSIKLELEKQHKKLDCYVSDRRWTKIGNLLKASAYFCGRDETNIVDCLLISHCIWSTKDNREEIIDIVEDAVRESGFDTGYNLIDIDLAKDNLEHDIEEAWLYDKNEYKTVKLGRKQYFEVEPADYSYNRQIIYIPYGEMKSQGQFHPVDENGIFIKEYRYQFNKQGSCKVEFLEDSNYNGGYWCDDTTYTPIVLNAIGTKKTKIDKRLSKSFQDDILKLSKQLEMIIKDTELKKEDFLKDLDTPFLEQTKIDIAIESVNQQIDDLKLRYKDCERLESLVG